MDGFLNPGLAHGLIQVSYFIAAILFISGLKKMSHPTTAKGGIVWAGVGMVVATLITFAEPQMHNYLLMTTAILMGGVLAWWSGKRVAMTDIPQMIALYNGMGGGAAAAIAAVELLRAATDRLALTARGWDRVRRVARTVADLAGEEAVGEGHVAEALSLRVAV